MSLSHFNKGQVFGVISELRLKKSKGMVPFLAIKLVCKNSRTGNIRVWGRIWGETMVKELTDFHRSNPRDIVHLEGIFCQYVKDKEYKHNYTFFSFNHHPNAVQRAVFILVGKVTFVGLDGDVHVRVYRDNKFKKKMVEENFRLAACSDSVLNQLEKDKEYKLLGVIKKASIDEFYGDSSGKDRPTIDKIVMND